ncbi:MAG: hypothetical protein ABT15_23190 [Pseudonocardia sp. SCN 73-27]|uniref:DUF4232 domain-containing protein n=1 Tax=unclassified Pseudonocardia TaxID=2619320 RepID=UPI00086AC759|nr:MULTISPECIES: DUF4232 domain-containing protein [unclassified Pseudonocardia]ODU25383.1 MAG: hypothetical protein ABS80_10270 [Pseudonocardia sp. SCN 72-51]ODV03298.1 MAG: hypothetical protein ABT15_23190 [Pseudonocardia sp. SCN 73-27]
MSILRLPLVAVAVAGAALLAGCGGGSATTPTQTPTAAPTTSAAAATTHASGGGVAKCVLADLKATLGATTGEAGQRHTAVVWTNTPSKECTMTGFGGVDLKGPNDPTFGPTYSLPRSAKTPSTVKLAPGATAHTTITWLPPQDGAGWTPTEMAVTPPDETRSAMVGWPGGAVQRQDGATRPGTFIDPVAAGSQG